jgi:fructose-1-phosphate kinase PfkB-like protein
MVFIIILWLGCGDNFVGGFIYGFVNNHSVDASIHYGLICSKLCIISKYSVHPDLSENLLKKFH